MWKRAEEILTKAAKEEKVETVPGIGEAAFYGPKLDFLVKDALGREWQCATIQLDFVQPERFGLEYVDNDGKKKRPVMIHKALLGSIERFISVYIEHTAGAFPLWLSPVQVKVIPIAEPHHSEARKVTASLKEAGFRVELDDSNESLGKRIRETKLQKIPYTIIIGDKDIEANMVTLESRKESLGQKSLNEVIDLLKEERDSRSL